NRASDFFGEPLTQNQSKMMDSTSSNNEIVTRPNPDGKGSGQQVAEHSGALCQDPIPRQTAHVVQRRRARLPILALPSAWYATRIPGKTRRPARCMPGITQTDIKRKEVARPNTKKTKERPPLTRAG